MIRVALKKHENRSSRTRVLSLSLVSAACSTTLASIDELSSDVEAFLSLSFQSGILKVDRSGTIMLTFWPAIGERKYDWEKRQKFALSATEVGSLISLGSKDSCEFFHDPSMLSSNAGQVRKSLSVKPHDSGYFISLAIGVNLLNNLQGTNLLRSKLIILGSLEPIFGKDNSHEVIDIELHKTPLVCLFFVFRSDFQQLLPPRLVNLLQLLEEIFFFVIDVL
ncbi:similar to WHIRLY 2 [Actinidia rufa]|uniref:Similar to WHIRLY 2 n=1 Tax=Actinidia rufa TaxID=165716 RepID=A0A7J0F9S9_9ERIC|nr:similar to WHIRLY 2 [Actinidia rufa]